MIPVRVRQLGRPVQSRQRAVVRAGAAARRLRRDERPLFRLGPRAEEPRERHIRGDMKVELHRGHQRTQRNTVVVVALVSVVSFVVVAARSDAVGAGAGRNHAAAPAVRRHRHLQPARRHDEGRRLPRGDPGARRHPGHALRVGAGQGDSLRAAEGDHRRRPAGKAILLLHHMDVVPADRSQWKTDPFTPTIQDGELWGRGSMDMKGQGSRSWSRS